MIKIIVSFNQNRMNSKMNDLNIFFNKRDNFGNKNLRINCPRINNAKCSKYQRNDHIIKDCPRIRTLRDQVNSEENSKLICEYCSENGHK